MDNHHGTCLIGHRTYLLKEEYQVLAQTLGRDVAIAVELGLKLLQGEALLGARKSGNHIAHQTIALLIVHSLEALACNLPLLCRIFCLGIRAAQQEEVEGDKCGTFEAQSAAAIGHLVGKVRACPIEHGHKVVGYGLYAARSKVADALLVYTVINDRFADYYAAYDANKENIKTWLTDNGYVYPTDDYGQKILRHYKCASMDTDAMLGVLFEHLTDNNMLDNTTVLLYSDHNAYYHNLTQLIKGTDIEDAGNLKTHTVPLMIYSSKLAGQTISNFCNTYDLYPTICNAFGLKHSKAFCLGVDLLSPDISNSMFMSFLTGFYSQTCYSKNAAVFRTYDGATDADVEVFKKLICQFYEKQINLDKIYYRSWTI